MATVEDLGRLKEKAKELEQRRARRQADKAVAEQRSKEALAELAALGCDSAEAAEKRLDALNGEIDGMVAEIERVLEEAGE
jgi:hypothetical protein